MTETTARLALPFILPGQAQKEAFHNEALAMLDAIVHPAVEEAPRADPPGDAAAGECWIVAASATGDWEDQEDRIAAWTVGGWRFFEPVPGMTAWNKAAGHWLHWTGSGWSGGEIVATAFLVEGQQVVGPRTPEVPNPSGGTTIDAEARSAIAALIATFKSHGLMD